MNLSLNVTPVFERLSRAVSLNRFNVLVFEGGSRSSKTYSIIQFFIVFALQRKTATRIVMSRKKGTWLYATVWNDFKRILSDMGMLRFVKINNSLHTILIGKTIFEFVGLDDTQKLHGLTCDIFWINEAMEAIKNDFDQLEQRCAMFSILDYNPSAEEHWIYDNVCRRKDCYFDHSTMLDNPFIPENMKRKILSYEPTEANYEQGTVDERKWKIYGLGERAKIEGLIFDYSIVKEIPQWAKKRWYGLDFGYSSDPTACSEVAFYNNTLYIDERFYETGMLTNDIIKKFKRMTPLKVISESADPRLITEIHNGGVNIHPVVKYGGSVEAGIDYMKGVKICITERSINAKKEFDNYTYQQDKNGKWLNVPIDDYNHIIDGVRYVCMMELMGKRKKVKDYSGVIAR